MLNAVMKFVGHTPSTAFPAVRVDKICSVALRLGLSETVSYEPRRRATVGDVVVVRVVREAPQYNQIELVSGRLARVVEGDVLVGALGHRKALKGFVGEVPDTLTPGERLHLLNLGGVIGRSTGGLQSLGRPTEVEYLGTVVDERGPVNLARTALPEVSTIDYDFPVVMVAGSCMHAGKTQAAAELVRQLTKNGFRVAAAKLSGVACQRDLLAMKDNGAIATLSFLDCGLPSTVGVGDVAKIARSILAQLGTLAPDVVVVELGDGILGGYNVDALLADSEIGRLRASLVFCASDFVGAYGGIELLGLRGIAIDAISGAATDSPMGVDFIRTRFGVQAANAMTDGPALYELVAAGIARWKAKGAGRGLQ
jgi:hypothetical protein